MQKLQILLQEQTHINGTQKRKPPVQQECRDFLKGEWECQRSSDKCWHVRKLGDGDVDSVHVIAEDKSQCYVCKNQFKTKFEMHEHKKVEHPSTTEYFKFKESKCTFGQRCWYSHEKTNEIGEKLNKSVFHHNQQNVQPPEQMMMKMMQNMLPMVMIKIKFQ